MSQYTSFYLKTAREVIPIAYFGASHAISQAFDQIAPWEKLHRLEPTDFEAVRTNIQGVIGACDENIKSNEAARDAILRASGDIDERMERWHEYGNWIEESIQEKSELVYAEDFVAFLESIIEENTAWGDNTHYAQILVGVEAGANDEVENPAPLSVRNADPENLQNS